MDLIHLIENKEILYIYNLFPYYLYDNYIIVYTNKFNLEDLPQDINIFALPVDD
mgnify:FL=1